MANTRELVETVAPILDCIEYFSIFMHQIDGTILYQNPIARQTLHINDSNPSNLFLLARTSQDLIESISSQFKLNGKARFQIERQSEDGAHLSFEICSCLVKSSIPDKLVISIAWDISEKKQEEKKLFEQKDKLEIEVMERTQQLHEQQQRLEYIIDFLPDATFAIDCNGVVIAWNKAIAEMTGIPATDMLGKGDYNYSVPFWGKKQPILIDSFFVSDPELEKRYSFIKQDQKDFIVETPMLSPKGEPLYLWGKATPLYNSKGEVIGAIESIRDITERKKAENALQESFNNLERLFEGSMKALAASAEKRDPYTAGHQLRVSLLATQIAYEMQLSEDQVNNVRIGAAIHDLGKMNIPSEILSKPGRLSDLEFLLIKTHPEVGYEIVKPIPFSENIGKILLQHHERLDGLGYPLGLKGSQILLEARIVAVADVVEAMSSHRPYRPALGIDVAFDEIQKNKGVLYDPEVVDACVKVFRKGFHF